MFSNAELEEMLSELNRAGPDGDVERIFGRVPDSIPPGHPKREDFLWKLNRASERLDGVAAERLACAASDRAADYAYGIMNTGEAAQGLNLVFTAAQKLSATPTAQRVLETAMALASDDTFALRILEFTGNRDRNKVLTNFSNIEAGAVKEAFMARMRRRYGPDRPVEEVGVRQGDWRAFQVWAQESANDREMELDFWRRFIGANRKRLAQAINFAFPTGFAWPPDPAPIVSTVFPTDEFGRLLRQLPENEPLDDLEQKAIARMERLVAGDWRGEGELPELNIS